MHDIRIFGRRSSHFTRVALMMAQELELAVPLTPIYELTEQDPRRYGGNPALKMPTLQVDGMAVFGTENVCRALHALSPAGSFVAWPEHVRAPVGRNAQELVWHAMAAQVHLILGTRVGKLPADNLYFEKIRTGLRGSLEWLDHHMDAALDTLPATRTVSLLEVTLYCLLTHLQFQPSVPIQHHAALAGFVQDFGTRRSAAQTAYQFDLRAT